MCLSKAKEGNMPKKHGSATKRKKLSTKIAARDLDSKKNPRGGAFELSKPPGNILPRPSMSMLK